MYRNSVRAHSRRRNAFGGKTLETRTVARTVDSSLPPINRRSTVGPTLSPSAIRRSEPPEHKRRIPAVSRREAFSLPPSSYSNASARDYDEGDEAVSESSSPSTGGSTFNQIDEVEHVSPLAEENEEPTRPTASTEDVSSSGRGKSPRVVLSKTFPQLSPRNVEQIATTIRQKGVPRELRFGRQNPALETASRSRALPAPGEASSSTPDPRPSSASHAPVASSSSDPNPPEADQTASAPLATRKKMVFLNSEVVQQQKCLLTRAETDEIHALLRGMSPDRTFIAPAAAPRPKTKVALGAKKVAAKPAADPPAVNVPDTTPIDTSSGGGAAPDLQVTLGPSRRGKEKRQEAEVEEVLTLKRTKRSASTRSPRRPSGEGRASLQPRRPDKGQGSRHRDHHGVVVQQARRANRRGYPPEGIREKEVVPLQKQVSAAEGRIRELEKELAAAEDRAEKAEKKLDEAEARADKAEKAEKEAIDKMKDASSLARFVYTDEAIAKEFLTAFINTEVGDKLTWVYGQWAFSTGCRAIEEQVHTALAEGLEDSDLPVVMALLPDKVADPGPRPYSKPGPSE
nr:serine/arginine repetitive matrix protein 2-like [Ipomoea batatas]